MQQSNKVLLLANPIDGELVHYVVVPSFCVEFDQLANTVIFNLHQGATPELAGLKESKGNDNNIIHRTSWEYELQVRESTYQANIWDFWQH